MKPPAIIHEDGRLSRRAFMAAGAAAVTLTGCSLPLVPGPAPQLYTLTPKSIFSGNLPIITQQLLIETPTAASSLNTRRVALRTDAFTVDYFADVSWVDRAPDMVQTLTIESFENTGRITSVGRESAGLRADFILKTELREFQAEYNGSVGENAPAVRTGLNLKLVKIPERTIVAAMNAQDVQQAASNRFQDIVVAFDNALNEVLREVVEWTLIEMEAAGT